MSTVAEQAGETVQAVVEQATANVEAVVENLEARAEAADAANEILTEAALRDRLSGRIGDVEEGLAECQENADLIENEMQALELSSLSQFQMLLQSLTALQAQVTALSLNSGHQSSSPDRQAEPRSNLSEMQATPPTLQAENADGDDHQEAAPKAKKGRLI